MPNLATRLLTCLWEASVSDFTNLPDITPPAAVAAIASRLGHVTWKRLTNPKQSSQSVAGLSLIAMADRDVDNHHVWFHELGHLIFRRDPRYANLARYVKDKFGTRIGRTKVIQLGAGHVFSHGGTSAELDEVWATHCALYWTDYAFPEDPTIRTALDMVLR